MRDRFMFRVLARTAGAICLFAALSAHAPLAADDEAQSKKTASVSQPDEGGAPIAVAEARERAKLMHAIYAATLDSMHHHYFRREHPVLPARALEDVFAEIGRQSKIQASWISVNTKAMSIHHEPKTDFEIQSARAIAAGKNEYERVDDGVYRRTGAIPLGAGCISCHTGLFNKTPQTPRFAGLVVSIPVKK